MEASVAKLQRIAAVAHMGIFERLDTGCLKIDGTH